MTASSSIRYMADRLLVTYREFDPAEAARSEVAERGLGLTLPVQEMGNKFAFGVTIQPGARVDALLDVFGQEGAGREANRPYMTKAALTADVRSAGMGLVEVKQEHGAIEADKFANLSVRLSERGVTTRA